MAIRDLRTAMTDEVFDTINGYDSSTDKLMFNNYGDKDNMTRTTDNWMHALIGSTGIPALNSRTYAGYVDGAIIGGVLVTPRHLMTSRHAAGQVGNVFYFWDRDNNIYTRTAIGAASAGTAYTTTYGDYVILTLDSDLPAAIEPVKVFPPNLFTYFDPTTITGAANSLVPSDETLIVSTDQEEKSLVHRITSIIFGDNMLEDPNPDTLVQPTYSSDGRVNYSAPADAEALGWRESMIAGDSGSPFFAIVDGELVLLGVAYTTSTMSGLTNYRVQNDINVLIANADADAISRGNLTTATGNTLTKIDLTGFKQYIGDLEYSFIGEDISSGFNIMYRGAAIDHNGYHYSIPYAASSIVRTDPRDNSQTFYNVSGISSSSQKWVDAIYAPNKRIYAAAHGAPGLLQINTEDPDNVIISTIGSYATQARGIALVDNGNGTGRILTTSYSGSQVVRRYSFDQNGATGLTHTSYTYPIELDPYFQYRDSIAADSAFSSQADIDLANLPFIYRSFWGAVNGGNGKVYGIPYGSAFVMVIDTTDDDSVTFLTDTALSGNAEFSNIPYNQDYLYLTSPQWSKYRGGVLASNGCIYTHGTHARAILKIDTATDTVTEIPYPQDILDAMKAGSPYPDSVGSKSASFFSYEGPDGKIYNTAWNVQYQISIDPTDDSIEFNDISDVLENQDATNGWYTAGATDNNTSFIAPGIADSVLQINYPGYSPAAYASVTPFSSSASPSPTPTNTQTSTQTPTQTPTQTKTPTQTQTPTPSNSEAYVPPVTLSVTGTPTNTPTQTQTPTTSNTPPNSPSVTPSNSEVPSLTPTPTNSVSNTQSATPSPSISISNSHTPTPSTSRPDVTQTPTPTVSNTSSQTPTPTGTPTQTATPSVTPTNNFDKCVKLEYDVADGPDRFIVTYKDVVIIDTGFVGNSAYQYGNSKRQVFIDALNKENLDLTGVELASDGYPTVNPLTEGSKEAVVNQMNERDAFIKIQSPVHDKPGWEYRLHCPKECVSPTPTQTSTPTGTQTPTPTPSGTPGFSSPAVPSPTPTGTPTSTGTPTPTPTNSGTPYFSPTQTGTPVATITPTNTSTPTQTPTQTQTPTNSTTPPNTPTTTNTPPATPASPTPTATNTPTPTTSTSVSNSVSNTPSNSAPAPSPSSTPPVTPSGTPPSTPTLTATPSNSTSNTPTPSNSGVPSPSASSTPPVTPSGTPPSTPTLTSTPTNTPTNTPTTSTSSVPEPSASSTPPVTPSGTPPSTPTLTSTPTNTGTPTPTVSNSGVPEASASSTPPVTPSGTPPGTPPVTPTQTPPNTPSSTPPETPPVTPSSTAPVTPTPTPSGSFVPAPSQSSLPPS